jgi:diketogulonate reductase-like aldo/keto reductase
MNISSGIKLNNGVAMPWLGLGVFQASEGGEVENAVKTALKLGYSSIDTASLYGNENGVGTGIKESDVPREEVFVTSKVWNSDQGYRSTMQAFEVSLDKLQMDYLDLYLIHWPRGKHSVETWKAMEELYEKGKIKAIGVSNFTVDHLEAFLPECNIKPAVNQVEFHPELVQQELLDYCHSKDIRLEAWSPIIKGKVNDLSVLQALAAKYGKTPVQVTLRWEIQKGVITIPKSANPERIASNADIFEFEISDEDMAKIDRLNKNNHIGPNPNSITF